MSAKQKAQQENQTKERRPQGAEQAQVDAALAAAPAGQARELGQLPDHATAGPLRRTAILQMQQRQGNAHVQRVLGNGRNRAAGGRERSSDGAGAEEAAHDQGLENGGSGPPTALPLPAPPNGGSPPENDAGGVGVVQRQGEEQGDSGPSEAQREAALAAAKAAEQQASQAADEGKKEVGKSKAEKASEQEAAKRAKEKKAQAAAQTSKKKGGKAPSPGGRPQTKPTANGAAPETTPGGAPGAGQPAAENKAPASPAEDPGFQAVTSKIGKVAGKQKTHAPAKKKTAEAQKAAEAPAAEIEARAQSNQVGEMEKAETPGFDAAGFKAQLMARIKALAPKTAAEADNFKESNKLGGVKDDMQGRVAEERQASQAPMEKATQKAPDTGSVEPKPVTPLKPAGPGGPPGGVEAQKAAPKRKKSAEVEEPFKAEGKKLDQQMAENNVTEEQLANSNEPAFQSALDAKGQAQTHAKEAPKQYRQFEQSQLSRAEADAAATAKSRTQAMHGDRAALLQTVAGRQARTRTEDEQARRKVAADIQKIYDKTKTNVERILSDLDSDVESAFDDGAAAARQAFENYVEAKMEAYKERRYGGWLGWARWVEDKVAGMPAEVNTFYSQGRRLYLAKMDAVIDNVVSIIGRGLNEAKAEIAKGKKEIREYVAQLPDDLKDVGRQAAQDIQQKFSALEQRVEDKQGELIDTLANKYQENLQAVDARIKEMKAANKGLVSKALDKIGGVIKTILELKNMLLGVLSRAAAAVEKIIKDPIGFLGNLVDGVKQGLQNFVGNIGQHLKKGLVGWLTGAMAEAGIRLPETFDLKGIFKLVMQILGLTFDKIRARVVKALGFDPFAIYDQIMSLVGIYQEEGLPGLAKRGLARLIGAERMEMLMQALPLFEMALEGDFDALWGMVSDRLSDLKETVFGQIQEFIAEKVIKAGIIWVISLLNPAGAFVRACKMIYDIVMFFVERGKQIMALVNAIIGSLSSLASGNLSGAAQAVEDALARSIPVAISFLASLLGLGGVSKRVRNIVKGVQAKVDKALDAVFNSKPVQMVSGFIRKAVGKVKGLAAAGVAKAKGMAKAGVEKVKGLGRAGADKAKGWFKKGKSKSAEKAGQEKTDDSTDVKKKARKRLTRRTQQPFKSYQELQNAVGEVLQQLRPEGLQQLTLNESSQKPGTYDVVAVASPGTKVDEAQVEQESIDLPFKVGDVISVRTLSSRGSKRGPLRRARIVDVNYELHGTRLVRCELLASPGEFEMFPAADARSRKGERWTPVGEHSDFQPKILDVEYVDDERVVRFGYEAADLPMTFTVRQRLSDFMTTSIAGRGLTFNPRPGERGVTEEVGTHVRGEGLNKAHLIADWFGGSGYKQSLNLITTSENFNKVVMRSVEDEIVQQYLSLGATSFDMKVDVTWGEFLQGQIDDALEAEIQKRVAAQVEQGQAATQKERVRAFIQENQARLKQAPRRCEEVRYYVTFKDKAGEQLDTLDRAIGPDEQAKIAGGT